MQDLQILMNRMVTSAGSISLVQKLNVPSMHFEVCPALTTPFQLMDHDELEFPSIRRVRPCSTVDACPMTNHVPGCNKKSTHSSAIVDAAGQLLISPPVSNVQEFQQRGRMRNRFRCKRRERQALDRLSQRRATAMQAAV
jgi:hypothetical protein